MDASAPGQTDINRVYDFIWEYLKTHDELPKARQIAQALNLSHSRVTTCVSYLRGNGKLKPRSLLPADYDQWWRENVRVDPRWNIPEPPQVGDSYKRMRRRRKKKAS